MQGYSSNLETRFVEVVRECWWDRVAVWAWQVGYCKVVYLPGVGIAIAYLDHRVWDRVSVQEQERERKERAV